MTGWTKYGVPLVLLFGQVLGWSQKATVTGRVDLIRTELSHSDPTHGDSIRSGPMNEKKGKAVNGTVDKSNVVVWLTPVDSPSEKNLLPAASVPQRAQLLQKDKSFKPHILVVPVGTVVDFPNRDPFFHNVFSYFEGRRFDLGLYESGTTRATRFDRPGVSYIFCNIHPEMSAVVVVMSTPYYAISDRAGQVSIAGVAPGRYILHVWHERSLPEVLKSLSREIVVSEETYSFGTLHIPETGNLYQTHKNKYGREYDSSEPITPAYNH